MAQLPLKFIAGLLNSDLVDWYFRLGSTNAHVSHYQLYNLPCPNFAPGDGLTSNKIVTGVQPAIEKDDFEAAESYIARLIMQPPFDPAIIATVVDRIIGAERDRGLISRAARSQLAAKSQAWQDVIDRMFALMAGISPTEHAALRERLATML